MSNTIGLIILIGMILVGLYYSKKEKKAKDKEVIDRNNHYKDEIAKSYLDYYHKMKELNPEKTVEEYNEMIKQQSIISGLYGVTMEVINREIHNK